MLRFIGLDIGTTTLSAVAIDGESGEVLKAITVDNDSVIASDDPARRMQNPEKIINKLLDLKEELVSEFSPVDAIGVTGQMHGIVYINTEGKSTGPLYTWQDASGSLPYNGTTYAEYLTALTGYPMASGYGLVTDYVNRDKGEVPADATTFCTIHDYAVMALTGRKTPLMHSSDAASYGCFSIKDGVFDATAIEKLGVDPSFVPDVTDEIAIAGNTPEGIPVTVAIGDNQASVIGSVKGDGCALVNIGTGSQVSVITHTPANFADGEVRPLAKNSYMLVGAPLCGGRSFALLYKFFKEAAALFGGDTSKIYPVMDAIAAEAPEEHELNVDTRFCGTRKSPEIKGSISSISDTNFTPAQLTRGFLHGMAKELYELYDGMLSLTDTPVIKIAGSGNAIRKSPVLKKYLEEMFGLPLNIPAHREEAAFGAALFASVASGKYSSLSDAQNVLVHYTEE